MFESPTNLQDFCLDYVCENVDALCEEQTEPNSPVTSLVFKNSDVFFPSHISEQLLTTLDEKKKLNDKTMTLFNSDVTHLKRVKITNTQLSLHGLRVLKGHKIIDLQVTGLEKVAVTDLLACLNEWTLSHLRYLNVANSTFVTGSKFCILVPLARLKRLQCLNVSHTEFNETGLDLLAQSLPCVETLDISGTPITDISNLQKFKGQLKSLTMYNVHYGYNESTIKTLVSLPHLMHLDISCDFSIQPPVPHDFIRENAELLLERLKCNANLTSIDLSGKEIKEASLM